MKPYKSSDEAFAGAREALDAAQRAGHSFVLVLAKAETGDGNYGGIDCFVAPGMASSIASALHKALDDVELMVKQDQMGED